MVSFLTKTLLRQSGVKSTQLKVFTSVKISQNSLISTVVLTKPVGSLLDEFQFTVVFM